MKGIIIKALLNSGQNQLLLVITFKSWFCIITFFLKKDTMISNLFFFSTDSVQQWKSFFKNVLDTHTHTDIYPQWQIVFTIYELSLSKIMHTTSWICNRDTLICKSAGPFVTRTETLPCYFSDVTISIVHSLARVEHCTFGNIWMWACFCLFLKTTRYLHLPDNIYESKFDLVNSTRVNYSHTFL